MDVTSHIRNRATGHAVPPELTEAEVAYLRASIDLAEFHITSLERVLWKKKEKLAKYERFNSVE